MKECARCKYFKETNDPKKYHSMCTRYPKWIEVFKHHYCGEFRSIGSNEM